MATMEEKQELAKKMVMTWIIWGAMFFSLLMYIIMAHLVMDQLDSNTLGPDFPLALFTNILFAVGVTEVVIAFFLRWFMLKMAGRKQADISQAAGKYTVIVLISCAICESVGIYGLVLFFLCQDFQLLYSFMFISAISMIYFRPKTRELEAILYGGGEGNKNE